MIVSINIQGAGTVTGGGEYTSGDIVSLEAIPSLNMKFKQYVIDGVTVQDNPYSFAAVDSDITVYTTFFLPVQNWLKSKTQYPVSDEEILSILSGRGISYDSDTNDTTQKQKDLAYADLLMLIVTSPSYGAEEDQLGNWKHKGKSITMTGKSQLLSMANTIYSKYGEISGNNRVIDITNRW